MFSNLPRNVRRVSILETGGNATGLPGHGIFQKVENAIKAWTLYLASGIEAGSAVVIGFAAIEAILRSCALFFQKGFQLAPDKKELIRLRLGRWLAVSLEFEVAADILRTAIAPSWTEIGKLAAIVGLRTALNYFLQQEIDREARSHPGQQVRQIGAHTGERPA